VTSKLSSLLVQEGAVSAKKIAQAFQRQVIYGGTLDTILLEMDVIDEPALIDALGRASALPTAGDLPSAEALQAAGASRWFPHSVCERYRAVPISLEGNVLRVLVTDPPDRKQLDELGYMLSLSVDPIVVPEHRFMQAVELVYHVALPARFASLAAKLRQRAATAPQPQVRAEPPVAKPEPPVAKPEPPVAKPEPPVAKVEPPVAKPEPPVAKPEPPVEPPPQEAPVRTVVTDVPLPLAKATASAPTPSVEHAEMPTPRLTLRQVAAPAAPISDVATHVRDEQPGAQALPLDEAATLIDHASDRDAIFEAVCRGGRSQLGFVALFTVQGDQAHGRLGLGEAWLEREALARIAVALDRPSGFQTVARGHAPFLGRLGDEPISDAALAALGRKSPVPALLAPVVLRERTVAIVYGDASGQPIAAETLAGISTLTAAAARAFQRLILKQKGGEYSKSPTAPSAKLSSATVEEARGGAWGKATDVGGHAKAAAGGALMRAVTPAEAAPRAELREQTTEPTERLLDLDALVASVLCADDKSPISADALLALGDRGALAVVARMPGPLKLARHTLRGPVPPLAEHGPLLSLIARFGRNAMTPLLARLNDPEVDVRYYATLAVGELAAPETIAPLGQRVLDPDGGVRQVAIGGLQRFGAEALRTLAESLRGELPGPDSLRQQFAAEALGALRDVASVPRLIDLVKHGDVAVVMAGRHALLEITKQDFGNSRWRWRSWWERHRDEPRVEWILEGLGHAEAEVRESASEELRTMTPENFGYHFDLPKREREEARKKWVDWWRAHGAKLQDKQP
jgi:hypothetical protein